MALGLGHGTGTGHQDRDGTHVVIGPALARGDDPRWGGEKKLPAGDGDPFSIGEWKDTRQIRKHRDGTPGLGRDTARCTNSGFSWTSRPPRLSQPGYGLSRPKRRIGGRCFLPHTRCSRDSAMQDTKFWRIIAVLVCVGLFYVGHGLHNRGGDGLPSFANVAYASGVAVDHPPDRGVAPYHIYTTDATGMFLYVWTADISGKPKYFGVAQQSVPFSEARKTDAAPLHKNP